MAMICRKCNGIIPDINISGRCGCEGHSKPDINLRW